MHRSSLRPRRWYRLRLFQLLRGRQEETGLTRPISNTQSKARAQRRTHSFPEPASNNNRPSIKSPYDLIPQRRPITDDLYQRLVCTVLYIA